MLGIGISVPRVRIPFNPGFEAVVSAGAATFAVPARTHAVTAGITVPATAATVAFPEASHVIAAGATVAASSATFTFPQRTHDVFAGASPLLYAPPDTTGYTTVSPNSTGFQQINLSAGTDYIVDMPGALKPGGLTLSGGRNVVLIGGEIEVEQSPSNDQRRRALYLTGQTGHVHIEGLHIHENSFDTDYDAVVINNNTATARFTFQNCLFEGIEGTSGGWHADGFQFITTCTFDGLFQLDMVTVKSNYQGWYCSHDGTDGVFQMNRTNFVCTGNNGVMLWMGDNADEVWARKFTDFQDEVYLDHTLGGTFLSEVRPNNTATLTNERPSVTDGVMTWPNSAYITGSLIEGSPPDGDFVTSSVAGHAYVNTMGYE